jgi:hypothetical protein
MPVKLYKNGQNNCEAVHGDLDMDTAGAGGRRLEGETEEE